MPQAVDRLIAILKEARERVGQPGADSIWSGWRTQADALREIDGRIAELEAGRMPRWRDLWVLFAPTGPMQEWSLDNGWGEEFLDLSGRFDAALLEIYPESARG